MSRSVVCISRATGAGGEEIARLAADQLGFRLVDDEVVARAAELAGRLPRRGGADRALQGPRRPRPRRHRRRHLGPEVHRAVPGGPLLAPHRPGARPDRRGRQRRHRRPRRQPRLRHTGRPARARDGLAPQPRRPPLAGATAIDERSAAKQVAASDRSAPATSIASTASSTNSPSSTTSPSTPTTSPPPQPPPSSPPPQGRSRTRPPFSSPTVYPPPRRRYAPHYRPSSRPHPRKLHRRRLSPHNTRPPALDRPSPTQTSALHTDGEEPGEVTPGPQALVLDSTFSSAVDCQRPHENATGR